MKYILFSDVHCNTKSCESIVQKANKADFAIGSGDYALFRKGLKKTIESLSLIKIPVILIHGNHESYSELADACRGLDNFHILHGNSIEINQVLFIGIGCAIPKTPFPSWSVDLSEESAWNFLPKPNKNFVFITHSPPFGCLDTLHNNKHIGSRTIRAFIEESKPMFVACGHIHERWNEQAYINNIPVINAGPNGYDFEC
ncbi:MAG: metallophosphoesterase family protein [Desulfamplus sp.]|nr:metallophosphoesterase family protein [Desulfamplus sp.]MBF0411511.1 metallophosphoesterase family protein [Desulfamplus sp.]